MKIEKNYFRIEVQALAKETENCPVIFTGKYKHTEESKWATFTTIRRYVPGEKTKTVCNHINIMRESVLRYLTLTEDMHNRKFYMCCRVSTYDHYGDIRACLVLAETGGESPLWMTLPSKNENELMVQRVLSAAQQVASPDADKRRR